MLPPCAKRCLRLSLRAVHPRQRGFVPKEIPLGQNDNVKVFDLGSGYFTARIVQKSSERFSSSR